jgi:molybdate transport system permease protein
MSVDPWAAIRLSIFVAGMATLLATPPALALAWVLARGRFRGKALLSTIVGAPLVLPPVVTGLLLLQLFGRNGALGAWLAEHGLPVVFAWPGAVLAALVMGFPQLVLTMRSAFEAVDPRFEEVARTLGASPAGAWARVTLPLAAPGIGAGMVLGFARALGEFGATAVLAGNMEGETRTLALAVYTLLQAPESTEELGTLVGASLGIALGSLIVHERLLARQRARKESPG